LGTKIYDIDNPERHVTVLHICPLTSPQLAVRAAVIQEYRNVKDPKKTKKVGRPKLSKDDTHARTIIVQVKDDDWKLFSKAAKANKLTNWPSSYPPREYHQSGHDGNQQGRLDDSQISIPPMFHFKNA
jgi:hypothetical protein